MLSPSVVMPNKAKSASASIALIIRSLLLINLMILLRTVDARYDELRTRSDVISNYSGYR